MIKIMYEALFWGPCCCNEVTVNIIIGEDFKDKTDIADLVKKYPTWTPGRTKKYKVKLGKTEPGGQRYIERPDLVGSTWPMYSHF